jgi:chromosome segregation ATPase
VIQRKSRRENDVNLPNFSGFTLTKAPVEMRPQRENARRICQEMSMAAVAMAEMTETRLARLESDVAHISSDVADLKTDMRGMRDEMRREFAEIRREFAELHKELTEVHKELAASGKAIIRGDLMNRIWTLLMCGAMQGVIARGLHWL